MLANLPTWLRAAVITGTQAAVASLTLWLLDVIADVQGWVSDPTNPVDISGAGKALVSILFTAVTFIVTAVYRAWKPVENSYPEPPKP
jgi:hypothetical protein